jgi:hypothetical protein
LGDAGSYLEADVETAFVGQRVHEMDDIDAEGGARAE